MIIDFHTHIFDKAILQNRDKYCSSDSCFSLLYSQEKAKLLCAEDLIRNMDDNGISKSVILNIGWVSHDMCVRTNDYILESIARYPGRLIGFCAIQPLEKEKALYEMERCFTCGAEGIGELRPDIQGVNLNDIDSMTAIVDMLMKFNKTILFHSSEPVGHDYPGKGDLTPYVLYRFIKHFKQAKIVLAHLGGGLPFYELMPEVSKDLNNIYYDTAAIPFLYQEQIYKLIIPIVGSNRILFGSDWPLLNPSRVIEHIKKAGIGKIDVEKILGINAANLLK